MHGPRRPISTCIVVIPAFFLIASGSALALPPVIDLAGRRVEIPDRISRVLAAGPPASILLYTLAPEKMIGWVRTPSSAEKAFLLDSVRELPEYGRLTGRGGTANLEDVLKFKPDLIIDIGSVGPTYVSLASNVQEQTKIPYVLLDGTFSKVPEIYRLLGDLLGVKDRAEELARYADETINGLTARITSIPEGERPRVYYGRGVNGLETGLAGSINVEVLERVGAINVAASPGTGGLTKNWLLVRCYFLGSPSPPGARAPVSFLSELKYKTRARSWVSSSDAATDATTLFFRSPVLYSVSAVRSSRSVMETISGMPTSTPSLRWHVKHSSASCAP
jgi:ABC-type Fe3+-hydroxamate transport system substrate-binding protein